MSTPIQAKQIQADFITVMHDVDVRLTRIEQMLLSLQEDLEQLRARHEAVQVSALRQAVGRPMRIVSPRLVHPAQLVDFELEVLEDAPDA